MKRWRLAAGGGLLHWVPAVAIAVMVLNDHALKSVMPGLVTGKLSDLAGLCFFPLLLQGILELVSERLWLPRNRRVVLVVCALETGFVFAAIKTSASAAWVYRYGLGLLRSPVTGGLTPVALVMDPTDLWVLPVLAVAVWCGWSRFDQQPGYASTQET